MPAPGPRATYRLQLGPDLDFRAVAGLAPQLAALGISHVYLSPVLTAAPGSTHGYDVADPMHLSAELGGTEGWSAMTAALRASRLRLLLDIVPNHMTTDARRNRWWRDVLECGAESRWAHYFDVDWTPDDPGLTGRILVPILGDELSVAMRSMRIRREGADISLLYGDHVLPVGPGPLAAEITRLALATGSSELTDIATDVAILAVDGDGVSRRREQHAQTRDRLRRRLERLDGSDREAARALDGALDALSDDPDRLATVLAGQMYVLAPWREAGRRLNHRRFFSITSLVGVRVEDAEVMEATHRRIGDLVRNGDVHGLRVDHVDGLRDPAGYLRALAERSGGAWTVVEKILGPEERLPAGWLCAGTTGYELGALLVCLSVEPAGRSRLVAHHAGICGPVPPFEETALAAKLEVLDGALATDLDRLARALEAALPDADPAALRAAGRALLAGMPVYRTYVAGTGGLATAADRAAIAAAAAVAERLTGGPAADAIQAVAALLRGEGWDAGGRGADAVARFEQLSPAVMAKGVEDAAIYRDTAVLALDEVGCDPGRPSLGVDAWHAWCIEATGRPLALLATATHDSKRGEDVRARLCALTEMAGSWEALVDRLRRTRRRRRTARLDESTELMTYQTLVGAWPIDAERLVAAVLKSVREAGVHTSWTQQDAAYERGLQRWVEGLATDPAVADAVGELLTDLGPLGEDVMLGWTLLRSTAPGVPDLYQGCERPTLTLVDPDNRRPVDHAATARLLPAAIDAGAAELVARRADGLPKLAVTARSLALRARRPDLFGPGSGYVPLLAEGAASGHVIAFARTAAGGGEPRAVVVAGRLRRSAGAGWAETTVRLPPGRWTDLLGGSRVEGDAAVPVASLLSPLPVALLELDG